MRGTIGGRLDRGDSSVGDFTISKGSRMCLRRTWTRRNYVWWWRSTLSETMAPQCGERRVRSRGERRILNVNWTYVSLRAIKASPRYRGTRTAPVATKAPHYEPSMSPLTLSLPFSPLSVSFSLVPVRSIFHTNRPTTLSRFPLNPWFIRSVLDIVLQKITCYKGKMYSSYKGRSIWTDCIPSQDNVKNYS